MERRERDRVNVKLECRVNRPGKASLGASAVTENISRNGMLIRWAQRGSPAPNVGESIVIRLRRPRNLMYGQRWMRFRARVVRVNSDEEALWIAVAGSREQRARPSRSPRGTEPMSPHIN